jgi:hypothetical protein
MTTRSGVYPQVTTAIDEDDPWKVDTWVWWMN